MERSKLSKNVCNMDRVRVCVCVQSASQQLTYPPRGRIWFPFFPRSEMEQYLFGIPLLKTDSLSLSLSLSIGGEFEETLMMKKKPEKMRKSRREKTANLCCHFHSAQSQSALWSPLRLRMFDVVASCCNLARHGKAEHGQHHTHTGPMKAAR